MLDGGEGGDTVRLHYYCTTACGIRGYPIHVGLEIRGHAEHFFLRLFVNLLKKLPRRL